MIRGVSSSGDAYDGFGRSSNGRSAATSDGAVRARHSLRLATTEVGGEGADDDAITGDDDDNDARPSLMIEKAVEATGANAARNKIRRRAIVVFVLGG